MGYKREREWFSILFLGFIGMLFGGWSVIAASYNIAPAAWAFFSVFVFSAAGCYINYKG